MFVVQLLAVFARERTLAAEGEEGKGLKLDEKKRLIANRVVASKKEERREEVEKKEVKREKKRARLSALQEKKNES